MVLSTDLSDSFAQFADPANRSAFFVKGQVAEQTQLTMAYNSNKNSETELFQHVDPQKYYPVTGDFSKKGFEAQSRGKLYAKIEKGRSSAMLGDYRLDNNAVEHDLVKSPRSMTGVNAVYDTGKVKVQGFAAQSQDNYVSENHNS